MGDVKMSPSTLSRSTALVAMLGGILWIGANSALAVRPPGVPGLVYRDDSGLGPFMTVALLLIGAGMAGVYVLHARHAGKLGRIGTIISLAGGMALLVGSGVVAINSDSWFVPLFI